MLISRCLSLAGASLALVGCASSPLWSHAQDNEASASMNTQCGDEPHWQETRVFLGMGQTEGNDFVTDFDLMDFVDEEVSPHFFGGYTMIRATGAWLDMDEQKTITEPSAVLVVMHPVSEETYLALEDIGKAYMERFNQPVILMASQDVCVDFISSSS